ncbi:hypothetical protein [Aeromonas salmonicida]
MEYLHRLLAIWERNQARQSPSKRKVFREIEEGFEPFGVLVRFRYQVDDLVKHGKSRSLSEQMSLGYHPLAYQLASHMRLTKAQQIARAKKPRKRIESELKEAVREIVAEHPDWTSEMIFNELGSDHHSGPDQLLEKIEEHVDYFVTNFGGKKTKKSTVRNWITGFKKKV